MIDKRGAAALVVIFISIIYFMFGMILYQFIKTDIALARTELDCAAPDTPGDMFNCLLVGSIIPIVVITILSVAGGYATEKALK